MSEGKYTVYTRICGQEMPVFDWHLHEQGREKCIGSGGGSLTYISLDAAVRDMVETVQSRTGCSARDMSFIVGDPPLKVGELPEAREAWARLEGLGHVRYGKGCREMILSRIRREMR
jgi:hypothetical protein